MKQRFEELGFELEDMELADQLDKAEMEVINLEVVVLAGSIDLCAVNDGEEINLVLDGVKIHELLSFEFNKIQKEYGDNPLIVNIKRRRTNKVCLDNITIDNSIKIVKITSDEKVKVKGKEVQLRDLYDYWNLSRTNESYLVEVGDLLDEHVIAHQTNCKAVMGSGVAKQIKLEYPEVFNRYTEYLDSFCERHQALGTTQLVRTRDDKMVLNMFSQYSFGKTYDGSVQTNYLSMMKALNDMKNIAYTAGITKIAFPYNVGCARGGGDFRIVGNMIANTFENSDIDVVFKEI